MRHPRGASVTVRRRESPGRDRYGDPLGGATSDRQVKGCAVYPWESSEGNTRDDQGSVIGYLVYAPPGTDVLETDQLVIHGRTCEVTAPPAVWVNPFSGFPNSDSVEIRAKFVRGS